MTPEKKVQNKIIEYLKQLEKRELPIYFERRQAGSFNYKKGLADIYVVYNGQHIEIEVKKPNGKQSIMQEKWQNKCKKLNIPYLCVNDVNEVITFFDLYFDIK